MTPHRDEPWVSADVIAAYLGISRRALYMRVRRGQIPASKLGASWRFRIKSVDAALRASTR